MADPGGGTLVCHNDVCLENVVFRDGEAIGLLDFDFAAPGRPTYDLAAFARMCVPVDDDLSAGRLGWGPVDRPARLRLVADTYGLDRSGATSCSATWTGPCTAVAHSCNVGPRPAIRTSSGCWTRWEGWSATSGDGVGGRRIGPPSSMRWHDPSGGNRWAHSWDPMAPGLRTRPSPVARAVAAHAPSGGDRFNLTSAGSWNLPSSRSHAVVATSPSSRLIGS